MTALDPHSQPPLCSSPWGDDPDLDPADYTAFDEEFYGPDDAADDLPELRDALYGPEEGLVDVLTPAELATEATKTRRAIRPWWLTSRTMLWKGIKQAADEAGYHFAYHALRVVGQVYWWKLAKWAGHGLWRSTGGLAAWVRDHETGVDRDIYRGTGDTIRMNHAAAQQKTNRRTRGALLLLVVIGAVIAWKTIPLWKLALASYLGIAVLGWRGRPPGTKVFSRAVRRDRRPPITSELIVRALGALGHPKINKALKDDPVNGINFPDHVMRVENGWEVSFDLPLGVPASDLVSQRDDFSSGLRQPEDCVWLYPRKRPHNSRVTLFVSEKSLSEMDPVVWRYASRGTVNVFKGYEFGHDAKGGPVVCRPMFSGGVIGAVPRMGKTVLTRNHALAWGLDVDTDVNVINAKGGSDYAACALFAHRLLSDNRAARLAPIALKALREILVELEEAYEVMETLDLDRNPDSQITEDMARDPRLNIRPKLIILEEIQRLYGIKTPLDGGDPGPGRKSIGKEIQELVEDIAKTAPAVGGTVIISTQKPDGETVPTGTRDMLGNRWCFKVEVPEHNDTVLGKGAHAAGYRATEFDLEDKGICWFKGSGDPVLCRVANVNGRLAMAIATRARQLRIDANRLTGMAAGETAPEADPSTLTLEDAYYAFPRTEDKMAGQDLLAVMAERDPERYYEWDPEQLAKALSPFGVRTVSVWSTKADGSKGNLRGYEQIALEEAFATHVGHDTLDEAALAAEMAAMEAELGEYGSGREQP